MYNMIIVDDELATAYELAELVNYKKYSLQVLGCFNDAESALAFIKENSVDLIISDIKMSDMNGIELLKIINEQYPHIKVILISAYRDFEYAKLAVSHNAFEYLTKPISFTEYINVLTRINNSMTKQKTFMLNSREASNALEHIFYDYFSDVATEEMFKKNLDSYHINPYSKCSLVELKINYIDNYFSNTFLYNADRFLTAVKNIVSSYKYECLILTQSHIKDIITLIILSDNDANYEDNLNNLFGYLKNQLSSLLCADTSISEVHQSSSVFLLKTILLENSTYVANNIMAHIINNSFDKIYELRDSFFSCASIEEQRKLCLHLSHLLEQTQPNDTLIKTVTELGLHSVSDTSTLIIYFNEMVDALQNKNNGKQFEKSIILEAIRYIEENYSKEITLSSVSNHVMFNSSYFSNFFKKQTGDTFSNFLLKTRMEHAKELLKSNPTMKIQTICENVGFKSHPYFYKVFQAYTGYSPSEYKKLMR